MFWQSSYYYSYGCLLEYECKLLFHPLHRNWSVVCHLPHSKINCLTECVTEMAVSDKEFGKLTSMLLQFDTRHSFSPSPRHRKPGYHQHVPVLVATKICVLQDIIGQQNIKINFYHPTWHSVINRNFAFMHITIESGY